MAMELNYKEIGQKIKDARDRAGLTQEKLAELLGNRQEQIPLPSRPSLDCLLALGKGSIEIEVYYAGSRESAPY